MNNFYSMADTTLTLKKLAKLIWKNLLLIVIVTALFGSLAYGTANYLLPARYTASMDFVAKGKALPSGRPEAKTSRQLTVFKILPSALASSIIPPMKLTTFRQRLCARTLPSAPRPDPTLIP
ncbi:Wzz/FepE/Etk N-terminal domain-containing protein [Lactobacillus delbrueckii]|uniref:Wzz/FepE/Etk N-terminal domain-containing protein n=1 Tax=Lactobacillus delbrueckii TaxID=1584 RepID=UPI001F1396B9|nr:Wzz/FepE/Etk N-terminal domain-containing protein [Lactobacillus delbrueckii]